MWQSDDEDEKEEDPEVAEARRLAESTRPFNAQVESHNQNPPKLPYMEPEPPLEPIIGSMPTPMVKHPKKQAQDGLIPQEYFTITKKPVFGAVKHLGDVSSKVELKHLVQFMKPWKPQDSPLEKLSVWLGSEKSSNIVVLVGQPGCGKATLARLLAEKHKLKVVCVKQGSGTLLEAVSAEYNDQSQTNRVLVVGQADVSNDFEAAAAKKESEKWVSFLKSVAASKSPVRTRLILTVNSLYSTAKLAHLKYMKKDCHVIQAYGRELKSYEARTISDLLIASCSGCNRAPLYTPTQRDAQQVQASFYNCLQGRGGADVGGALQQMSFVYILPPQSATATKQSVVPNIDSAFSAVKHIINNRFQPDALEPCASVDTLQLTTLVLNNMHVFADACEGPKSDLIALEKMSETLDSAGALDLCPVWSSGHSAVAQSFVATVGAKFPCRSFYKLEWKRRENDAVKAAVEVYKLVHAKLVDTALFRTWGTFIESVGLLTPSHIGCIARDTVLQGSKIAWLALMNSSGLLLSEHGRDASAMPVVVISKFGVSRKRKPDSSNPQEKKAQASTAPQKEPSASKPKKARKKK